MAIAFKFRLPRRLRSKQNTATPPSEPASPRRSSKEDEFRQVFRFLDTDNDGKISAEELRAYFASVGETMSHEEAVKIIGELSKGGADEDSLLLEFGVFVRVVELRESDDDVILRQAFAVYEEDKGSGCITAEGLRKVLRRLGDVKSIEECKDMIGVYDLDGNGVLDFDEFYKMMMA